MSHSAKTPRTICQFRVSPSIPTIRFDPSQDTPIIAQFTSRRGKRTVLFVGADHASVWIRQDSLEGALPVTLLEGVVREADRRFTVGLVQPHWARVAQEWVFRGHIDMQALADQTLLAAVNKRDEDAELQRAS
ncbi:hypothetical protein [Halomonas colorata]|uniref:Uncharacterized protein n=1 Tax=Halomonas colorata TaxID=2742615 RepID=A0ABR9G398_9GAMM|nr:hypothetical protein [Halomonas colorata]MBE0465405.1 hypothetical protein [Halomonas colorata]